MRKAFLLCLLLCCFCLSHAEAASKKTASSKRFIFKKPLPRLQAKKNPDEEYVKMLVTGYCKCKQCTGWKRNLFFQPVFASGPLKGQRKKVGVTASDQEAEKGVIAADVSRYSFGTVMDIPCYGKGIVQDTGSGIQGAHIDLYFDSHEEALRWGKKVLTIRVHRKSSKRCR